MRITKYITAFAAVIICTGMTVSAALSDNEISALDTGLHGYGQGVECDENNCPVGATMFNDEFGCYDSYACFDSDKNICLTFDQGYENGYTASILDTLKEKNVKALFFLTGDYAKRNKELVQRMLDEGHVIGNHGMTHKSIPTLSPDGIVEELDSLNKFVSEEYGYDMVYFRPPCGEYSEQSLAVCSKAGYKTLLWSFAYCDWDTNKQPDAETAYSKITDSAHGGEIILLHSVSSTNAEVLPRIIDEIRAQGFEFALPSV